MAYTNLWPATPEAAPPDSELAKLLAKNIRDLELNIRERMDDVFTAASGRWAVSGPASPIVPADKLTGKKLGKMIAIHNSAYAFNPGSFLRTALFIQDSAGGGGLLWAPLILPDQVTIQAVSFVVNRATAAPNNITCRLRYNANDAIPATTTVATVSTTVNGVSLIAAASLGHLVRIDLGRFYFLEVEFPNNFGVATPVFYASRVIYDAPDCRNTI